MSDERGGLFGRAEEFMNLFKRGAEFTKELIHENERLRRRVLELEQGQVFAARDDGEWDKLRSQLLMRIESLQEEHQNALERLRQLEEENHQFARRYVEVEEENNNLANLYVASFQLHSTLDLSEVVKIVIEIVINLVGAELFAVYLFDEKTGQLEVVAAEGDAVDSFPRIALGQGTIGRSVEAGETHAAVTAEGADRTEPLVCIPLRVQDAPIGAIAIHRLLQQKTGFTALDHELFTLLAGHAATAIFSSRLYSQSERKRNTIQGFIDLLTK